MTTQAEHFTSISEVERNVFLLFPSPFHILAPALQCREKGLQCLLGAFEKPALAREVRHLGSHDSCARVRVDD